VKIFPVSLRFTKSRSKIKH